MESFLKAFVAHFVMVDPVGNAFVSNALTEDSDDRYRRAMAVRAVVLSASLVLLFGLWGVDLLGALGIQMTAFSV